MCSGGSTKCGNQCTNTNTDPANCGACGNACATGPCVAGACQCADGQKNGAETDIDCGGGTCAACAAGKSCKNSSDCASGLQCVTGKCTSQTPPIDSDLVGYWKLDGNAMDSSGNANEGTVFNMTPSAGKVGTAYQSTGSGCILIPDSASLQMVGYQQLTMMAWVDQAGCPPNGNGTIVNKELTYEMAGNGCNPQFQEAIQPLGQGWFWTGSTALPFNAWTLTAVTWDGTTVRQYLNGVQVGTRAMTGQFGPQGSGLGLGCRGVPANGSSTGISGFFAGTIDEVSLYRRALTAAEILAYYNATK